MSWLLLEAPPPATRDIGNVQTSLHPTLPEVPSVEAVLGQQLVITKATKFLKRLAGNVDPRSYEEEKQKLEYFVDNSETASLNLAMYEYQFDIRYLVMEAKTA